MIAVRKYSWVATGNQLSSFKSGENMVVFMRVGHNTSGEILNGS